MNKIKVSIIVPVYNLEEYVGKCLDSLIRQTYSNIEIIVVNDGSQDRSLEIINEFAEHDDRIICLNQRNSGAAKARNLALDIMTGQLFTFVDGDDMLSPDTIERLFPLFENSELDWVEFPVSRVNKYGEELSKIRDYGNFLPQKEELVSRCDIISFMIEHKLSELCCACIYRTSTFSKLRFPENEYYEDSFYFTDIIAQTRNGYISTKGKYLYVERAGSSQLTSLNFGRLQSKANCIIDRLTKFRKFAPFHEKYYADIENKMYYFLKKQRAKNINGASIVFDMFCLKMKNRHIFNLKEEIKILIYPIIAKLM